MNRDSARKLKTHYSNGSLSVIPPEGEFQSVPAGAYPVTDPKETTLVQLLTTRW